MRENKTEKKARAKKVVDVLKENYVGNQHYSCSGDIGLNLIYRPSSWTYWFGFSTKYKICFFENSLKIYEDNTKLQRC